jgi:hypothetical protein
MDNIQAWFNYEAPQNQVTIPQQQRQQKGRFWTIEEHRLIFFYIYIYKLNLAHTYISTILENS